MMAEEAIHWINLFCGLAQLQGGSDDCSRLCVGHVSSSPLKTFSTIKIVNAYLRELGCPGSVNDEQL